jgi:hypothetical protein
VTTGSRTSVATRSAADPAAAVGQVNGLRGARRCRGDRAALDAVRELPRAAGQNRRRSCRTLRDDRPADHRSRSGRRPTRRRSARSCSVRQSIRPAWPIRVGRKRAGPRFRVRAARRRRGGVADGPTDTRPQAVQSEGNKRKRPPHGLRVARADLPPVTPGSSLWSPHRSSRSSARPRPWRP